VPGTRAPRVTTQGRITAVALAVPLDDEGRAFIKRLENPKHDGLSADRLSSLESQAQAKSVMKKFATTIRDAIKSVALTKFDDEVSADEMRPFFQAEAAKPENPGPSAQDDPETVKYRLEPKKVPEPPRVTGKGEGNTVGPRPRPGPGPGPGPGPSPGPTPRPPVSGTRMSARPIVLSDVRNLLPSTATRVCAPSCSRHPKAAVPRSCWKRRDSPTAKI
jgi:hypothetical protein